jgi:hypothetical protein
MRVIGDREAKGMRRDTSGWRVRRNPACAGGRLPLTVRARARIVARRLPHPTRMPSYSRRAFLGALAAVVPATLVVRHAHAAAGQRTTVEGFQRWIAGYREHAELVHLYGTSTIEWTGPSPAMRWAAQLTALDAAARREGARTFAALAPAARLTLVRGQLDALHAERIPSLMQAPHVALALLAYFYESPAATDLCYRSAIMPQQCRPLAAQARRPLPFATGRGT